MYDIKIKFGGESHMIDSNTLINSLIHFTNVVQEANNELAPDRKVDIKIKANKEGSFEVEMALVSSTVIDVVKSVFSADNVTYVSALGSVVGGIYATAKFLLGKKPKQITAPDKENNITITNYNGEVKTFDFRGATIYLNNPKVREAISQEFETLERDENVTDFELLDKDNKPIVTIDKVEFPTLFNDEYDDISTNEILGKVENASLNIVSLDWELKKKWEFYYLGNKISAKIKDNIFGEKIDKGERFGKGDTLIVDMEVKQEFIESVNTYVNKSYTIIKIHKHIERNIQGKLDLDNLKDDN